MDSYDSLNDLLQMRMQLKELVGRMDYQEAKRLAESGIRRWPDADLLRSSLGEICTRMGRPDEALSPYEEAVRLDPNNSSHHYNLGCTYMALVNITGARRSFQHALDLDPGYWKAMANLSELAPNIKESFRYAEMSLIAKPADVVRPDARQEVEELRRMAADPKFHFGQYQLDRLMRALVTGDFHHARLYCALAGEAGETGAPLQDALILRNQGRLSEAISILESVAQSGQSSACIWNNLSNWRYQLACASNTPRDQVSVLLQGAIDGGKKSIELGDYSKPHQILSAAFLQQRNLAEARREAMLSINMCERQMEIRPGEAPICIGCPALGTALQNCERCLNDANARLRDTGGG